MIELKIDILYEAIEKQVNIELRHAETKPDEVLFLSAFIQYDTGEKVITIDFPTVSSTMGSLKKNDPVVVKFIHKESPFIFNSSVLGITGYEAPGEPKKQVMQLILPESIFGDERRNFLKVNTPPFAVTARVVDSKDMAKRLSKRTYRTEAVNISAGGIAIEDSEQDMPLSEGDILDLKIDFPDQTVHMEGELLNIYQFEKSGKMGFGIKFIQRNLDRLNYNKTVKVITRYVMRRERELLSR